MPTPSRRKAAERPVAPEDLLQYQLVSDPQISPDGSLVLFTRKHVGTKNEYVTNLWLVAADGQSPPRQFTSGGKDGHGRWSPDGKWIAFISRRDKSKPQIYVMEAAGGEATALTKLPEGSLREFRWSPDGTKLAAAFRETEAVWTEAAKKEREEKGLSIPARVIDDVFYRFDGDGYFNAQRFALYRIDAMSGAHKCIFDKDRLGEFTFDWSPDSTQVAVAANPDPDAPMKPWEDKLFRIDVETGKVHKVPHLPLGTKTCVRWSPDGKWLAYVGREGIQDVWGVGNQRLYVCDPETGHPRDLTGDDDYCLTAVTLSDSREAVFNANVVWSRDSRRLFTTLGWHGETHIASVPIGGGNFTRHTQGERNYDLGNFSSDGTSVALAFSTQLELGEVAVGEFGANAPPAKKSTATNVSPLEVTRLTHFNRPFLEQLSLSPVECHWLKSPSGTKVQTWVMKPPGFKSGKKYPAVLEIHGGPHTQYGLSYFHEFQTLASAGYVVVFSNPRGSKGYGEAHTAAIKGNWGNADWEDIQTVITFMQSQSYIDPKRMGVMGGSYGGYMTNWVIGHTDVFAGAITDRCVSNLVSMSGSSDIPLVPDHYWPGNAWDKPEALWAQSPLKYFGNVTTPTMVIHSEGDLRCNVEQGEQVFATLKLRGIPSRFVRYPSTTSHGLSRSGPPDLRIHRLQQILKWWEEHLSSK